MDQENRVSELDIPQDLTHDEISAITGAWGSGFFHDVGYVIGVAAKGFAYGVATSYGGIS